MRKVWYVYDDLINIIRSILIVHCLFTKSIHLYQLNHLVGISKGIKEVKYFKGIEIKIWIK